jgi:hypothetical protein
MIRLPDAAAPTANAPSSAALLSSHLAPLSRQGFIKNEALAGEGLGVRALLPPRLDPQTGRFRWFGNFAAAPEKNSHQNQLDTLLRILQRSKMVHSRLSVTALGHHGYGGWP